jgi:hypothetical protein
VTYVGSAHLSGPQGDLIADKIEAAPSSRPETSWSARKGDHVTLTDGTEDDRQPRHVLRRRRTVNRDRRRRRSPTNAGIRRGRTLTFHKATDTIKVDGEKQFRTY